MRDDQSRRAAAHGVKQDSALIDSDGICVTGNDLVIDETVPRIEKEHNEAFVASKANDILQEINNTNVREWLALAQLVGRGVNHQVPGAGEHSCCGKTDLFSD